MRYQVFGLVGFSFVVVSIYLSTPQVFTKCKESLQDGRRLENISWRLWYREMKRDGSKNRLYQGDVNEKEQDQALKPHGSHTPTNPYRPPTPSESSSPPPPYLANGLIDLTLSTRPTALPQDHDHSSQSLSFRLFPLFLSFVSNGLGPFSSCFIFAPRLGFFWPRNQKSSFYFMFHLNSILFVPSSPCLPAHTHSSRFLSAVCTAGQRPSRIAVLSEAAYVSLFSHFEFPFMTSRDYVKGVIALPTPFLFSTANQYTLFFF